MRIYRITRTATGATWTYAAPSADAAAAAFARDIGKVSSEGIDVTDVTGEVNSISDMMVEIYRRSRHEDHEQLVRSILEIGAECAQSPWWDLPTLEESARRDLAEAEMYIKPRDHLRGRSPAMIAAEKPRKVYAAVRDAAAKIRAARDGVPVNPCYLVVPVGIRESVAAALYFLEHGRRPQEGDKPWLGGVESEK